MKRIGSVLIVFGVGLVVGFGAYLGYLLGQNWSEISNPQTGGYLTWFGNGVASMVFMLFGIGFIFAGCKIRKKQ